LSEIAANLNQPESDPRSAEPSDAKAPSPLQTPSHRTTLSAICKDSCTMAQHDPVHPADAGDRSMAKDLLAKARYGALAYTDPVTRTPGISRIATSLLRGVPVTLISALSAHHAALIADPACALMVGEPGAKGDPLTHPRLMVQAHATFIARSDAAGLRDLWLQTHPKARLYIDFADFTFVRLTPQSVFLNAGFGQAYRLTPADLLS
jgi:heme iron utilization protein